MVGDNDRSVCRVAFLPPPRFGRWGPYGSRRRKRASSPWGS